MNRLEEIAARLAAIATEAEAPGADLAALNAETTALLEERRQLLEQAQQRNALLGRIANGELGTVVPGATGTQQPATETRTREEVLASPEYRSAWAKRLMRRPDNAFTDAEQRALGAVLTTTATTATTATSSVDGVNNGGLHIPTDVLDSFLNEIALLSPVFNDINRVNVSGIVSLPYKKSTSAAKSRKEGTANTDAEFVWAEVKITLAEVSATVRVTWKLETMTPDSFINYLVNELVADHGEQIIEQLIYGTGTGNDTLGITKHEVIDGTYTEGAKILEVIETNLKKMNARAKSGAKIYLSTDLAEAVTFSKDGNGAYVLNPINSVGVNSVARYQVEVDPYLHAGDFLIGALKRNTLAQFAEDVSVTKDVSGRERINDYTSYSVIGIAVKPNTILYGKANKAAS